MRWNITDVPEELAQAAKIAAVERRVSLRQLVIDSVAKEVGREGGNQEAVREPRGAGVGGGKSGRKESVSKGDSVPGVSRRKKASGVVRVEKSEAAKVKSEACPHCRFDVKGTGRLFCEQCRNWFTRE